MLAERGQVERGTIEKVEVTQYYTFYVAGKMRTIREIFKDAFDETRQEGRNETYENVATDMLRDGIPLAQIAKYSRLAEDTIRNLAASLGLSVTQ